MVNTQKTTRVQDTYYYLMLGLIVFACACSIFAQIPDLNLGLRNLLNYFPWIIAVLYLVFYVNYVNLAHFQLLLLPSVVIFMYLLGLFVGKSYDFNLFRALIITSLVFCVGVVLGENIPEKHFKLILKAICIVTLIFALYLYFQVLGGGTLYSDREEGVDGKNSLSLIVAVPIVIMLYTSDIFPRLRWGFIPFLVFLVILMRSRTSMVCALGALIGKVFIGNRSRKEKVLYTIALCIVIYLFVINEKMYDRVINQIFFRGKELNEENMSAITSGRSEMQKGFSQAFKWVWFVGGGGYAYENFYMDTLIKYGLFGAVPVFLFAFSPSIYFFKDFKDKQNKEFRALLLALNVLMLISGIGEEMPPFGPGVKCFVLWLTFGYYIGRRYKIKGEKRW